MESSRVAEVLNPCASQRTRSLPSRAAVDHSELVRTGNETRQYGLRPENDTVAGASA